MKIIGYAVTTVVFILISSIWSGYVLSKLWSWFVVTTFSLPEIGVATAIGLALTIGYLTKGEEKADAEGKEFGELLLEAIIKALMKPTFTLGIGWVITVFL
jgi:uncharacterized membrane protein